jgi:TPR repeat protein
MYWYGEGVMRDEDQGMRWLIRADDAGSMEASILLESLTRDKHYMWKGEMVPHAILN